MSKQWNELSVLIMGCGSIGKRHGRALQILGVRDLWAFDPSAKAREAMAAQIPSIKLYDSYETVLGNRPDAAIICTPTNTHVPMAIEVIKAGCHVLSEKPISNSSDRIDELIALAERSKKKVMVALCFRYHAGVVKAYEYLQSAKMGRLVSIRALVGEHLPDIRPDYKTVLSFTQEGVFELMHDLDLALWMADKPVKKINCVHGSYSDIELGVADIAEFLIDFEGNCMATVHLDLFQHPRRRQLELFCTKGTIILEFSSWDVCTVSVYQAQNAAWQHEQIRTDRDDMFRAEDAEFLHCVAKDLPIKCTVEEGMKSLKAIEIVR
jgi:predicted dehydrogenase